MVLGDKVRELHLWSQDIEALEVRNAWNFCGSSYPSLNEILSTMKGSGWTLEIADDETCIFSRSSDSSSLKENSVIQELIMDNKKDMTLSQLAIIELDIVMTLPQKTSPQIFVKQRSQMNRME